MDNFDWLDELTSGFPKLSKQRRNLIEISGYPSWENVNSNLLTFYFDENEEHGFGRLFINSLIDLLKDHLTEMNLSRDFFAIPFKVERERNRIDILITGYEYDDFNADNYKWAILIENKIHADLYNDLKVYWKSLKKPEIKIGIALTLKGIDSTKLSFLYEGTKIKFVNLYHSDLINSIKSNLSEYFQQSDDRHLLFLKEYIMNIENHYSNPEKNVQFESKLKLIQKYANKIREFEGFKKELHAYCIGVLYETMQQNYFISNSPSKNIKSIHFYPDEGHEDQYKWFRFWMSFGNIEFGEITTYFELYGESVKYGQKVRENLRTQNLFNILNITEGNKQGKEYYHIAVVENYHLGLDEKKLSDTLNDLINIRFFNTTNNLINEVAKIIKEIEDAKL